MTKLKDLQIGEELHILKLAPVSRMDLIKYSGASGDYNPIHTIDEEAKKLGLPGIIAHGMWTMGNLAKLFTPYYDEGFIKDYKIRFNGMVLLNDVVTLKAALIRIEEKQYTFSVSANNQQGSLVIKGEVVYFVY